jgi:hypothetical protein
MRIHDDQFDFAAFLRAEARDAEADARAHPGDNAPFAPIVSKQSLERDTALSGAGKGTDDQNGNAGRRQDGIGIDHQMREFRIQGLKSEQVAIPFPSDASRAPVSARSPADPSSGCRNGPTPMKTPLKFERPSALLSWVKSTLTAAALPLRRNFIGAAALVLMAGAIVVVLAHYIVLRPSTDLSGTSKIASTNPQLVEALRLPPARTEAPPIAVRESVPIGSSLNAIKPESVRDTVDPEIKLQSSSEVKTPDSVPRAAFASVKTAASSENMPSSDLPKLVSTYSPPASARPLPPPPSEVVLPTTRRSAPIAASLNAIRPASVRNTADPEIKLRGSFEANTPESSENQPPSDPPKLASTYSPPGAARPLPVSPIEAVPATRQQSAASSRIARGTTASLSQSTPSTVSKATALYPDTLQPHIGDVARRKHDQKPSKALETGSCVADIFPGYVQAGARLALRNALGTLISAAGKLEQSAASSRQRRMSRKSVLISMPHSWSLCAALSHLQFVQTCPIETEWSQRGANGMARGGPDRGCPGLVQ